jgi:DNA uptake protein ComE-like DNA-binding protein
MTTRCALILALFAAPLSAQVGRNTAVLNPNLAGEADLAAVPGMTPDVVRTLIARRPFLSMREFDAHLRPLMPDEQRAGLYRRVFVPVDLVTAPREELLLVPGVGPRMAHEFEEYRPWTGGLVRFRREIGKYVDSSEVARLEQYVFIPLDLNSASDEEILSIPGVGPRMLHEFKEYRPYTSMAQFRREIGKYVNEREVARLERYVTIRP